MLVQVISSWILHQIAYFYHSITLCKTNYIIISITLYIPSQVVTS